MKARRRASVPVVHQMEAAECGVACLAMVLAHFGCHVPLSELRSLCGSSRDGHSARELLACARSFGLEARGLAVRPFSLKRLACPAILHWSGNHFVVLESVRDAGIAIVDPSSGRRFVGAGEVSRALSGVALELAPGPDFRRRARRSPSFTRYLALLSRHRGVALYVLVANLAAQFLALLPVASTQFLIDHTVIPARHGWLIPVLTVMLLAALTRLLLTKAQGTAQLLLQTQLGTELTLELATRLLRLPLPFLESRSRGDLLSRVQMQGELKTLITHAAQALFDPLLLLLLGLLMLAYDWRLGTATLLGVAARVWIVRRAALALEPRVGAQLAARGREQSALLEATSNAELIKGLSLEGAAWERYRRHATECAATSLAADRFGKGLTAWLTIYDGLVEGALLAFAGTRVIAGDITLGIFAGFLSIRGLLQAPLGSMTSLFDSWVRLRGVLERSDEILTERPSPLGTRGNAPVRPRLVARNLGYRYGSGGPWILRGVDLSIEAGEKVAVIGASGEGKSTLLKLLAGLLEPTEGEVRLDEIALAELAPAQRAERVGVVLQDPLILEGSVADSLRLRAPEATDAELRRAARVACFDGVLERLPGNLRGAVAALGSNLSGGERQRLALAQALVGEPPILLLDEGTCALDGETEKQVLDNLDRLSSTIVSVAHRAAVAARAERVLRVASGKVEELSGAERLSAFAASAQQRSYGLVHQELGA